jgi:hypothetical protein
VYVTKVVLLAHRTLHSSGLWLLGIGRLTVYALWNAGPNRAAWPLEPHGPDACCEGEPGDVAVLPAFTL